MGTESIGINGFVLKWIAIVTMVIDHIGAILYPQEIGFRIIGRIAFPIFCFLLVEGSMHTRDIRRYEKRLLLFALLSELPFDLAFYGKPSFYSQNVFFTLFLGLLMIEVLHSHKKIDYQMFAVLGACIAAELLHTDYGAGGVLFILCFYLLYHHKIWKIVVFALLNLFYFGLGIQIYALACIVPVFLYNGRKGPGMKYLFYVFYPAHLLILYLISRF